jgi:hypothetical protein
VVLAVLLLLAKTGDARVRTCPECRSAFIKTGRRLYCSEGAGRVYSLLRPIAKAAR